jgi:hypothetical protein
MIPRGEAARQPPHPAIQFITTGRLWRTSEPAQVPIAITERGPEFESDWILMNELGWAAIQGRRNADLAPFGHLLLVLATFRFQQFADKRR